MNLDLLRPKEKRRLWNFGEAKDSKLKRILVENLAIALVYSSCFFMSYNTSQKVFLHFLKNNSNKPSVEHIQKPIKKKNLEEKITYTKKDLEQLITKYSIAHGLDPALMIALAYAESNLNPNAESRKGAIGVMQVYPTKDNLEFCGLTKSELYNPEKNIECGIKLYKHIYEKIPVQDEEMRLILGLAAYNWGLGRVLKLIKRLPKYSSIKHIYKKFPGETRHYIKRVYENYSKPLPIKL